MRNGRFYAQVTIPDANTGKKSVRRVSLGKLRTTAEAVKALERLRVQREDNTLPVLRRSPTFEEYAKQYFDYYEKVKDAKRPATIGKEKTAVRLWNEHLGHVRLHQINRAMINGFIAKRQANGISGRTVNLDIIGLRNVLKRAVDDGWLTRLPTENLRPLKWTPRKRDLFTGNEIDQLCEHALRCCKNGVEFADYVRLMAYGGSRRSETLRLKWSDVDWQRKQLTIGSDGLAKNHKPRVLDFNPSLEAHLHQMFDRRAPDSEWIFPSPQRGVEDRSAKTFQETLKVARKTSGLTCFSFHDCRHFFISMCVMSGIDFMTIARWVGHQDGGVLIGKVYGHLSNKHAQRQAQKVVFTPAVIEPPVESALPSQLS